MFMALDLMNADSEHRQYDSKAFLEMGAGPKFFSPDEFESEATPDVIRAFARAFSPEAAQTHGFKDDGHVLLYTESEFLAVFRKMHAHFNNHLFHQQRARSSKIDLIEPDALQSATHGLRHDDESLISGTHRYSGPIVYGVADMLISHDIHDGAGGPKVSQESLHERGIWTVCPWYVWR